MNLEQIKWDKKISTTALKEATKGIRSFVWYYNKQKEVKKHFDFGNALELYVIDTELFYKEVAVFDDSAIIQEIGGAKPRATTKYRDWKLKFETENEGKYIISMDGEDSFDTIIKLNELLKEHPKALELLKGEYQVAFEWQCQRTGLLRYCRTDIYNKPDGVIVDIKTDATGDFPRACGNNDYFMQAFDHITGALESGSIEKVKEYWWVVFTKKPPYGVDVFRLELDQLLRVEEKYYSTLGLIMDAKIEPPYIYQDLNTIKPQNYYK